MASQRVDAPEIKKVLENLSHLASNGLSSGKRKQAVQLHGNLSKIFEARKKRTEILVPGGLYQDATEFIAKHLQPAPAASA